MVTPDVITAIAPELSAETPETISLFIGMAQARISPVVWGTLYYQGITFLAAHLLTMKNRRGLSGSQTMQKVGDIEIQNSVLAKGNKTDLAFLQTSYGVEYLALRDLVVIGPMPV